MTKEFNLSDKIELVKEELKEHIEKTKEPKSEWVHCCIKGS